MLRFDRTDRCLIKWAEITDRDDIDVVKPSAKTTLDTIILQNIGPDVTSLHDENRKRYLESLNR